MSLTRRTLLATGALAGLAAGLGHWTQSTQFASARRLLIDATSLPDRQQFHAFARVVVTPDCFADSRFVRNLACGAYEAHLTPANELLLLEVCRELRIATAVSSQSVLFEIDAAHPAPAA